MSFYTEAPPCSSMPNHPQAALCKLSEWAACEKATAKELALVQNAQLIVLDMRQLTRTLHAVRVVALHRILKWHAAVLSAVHRAADRALQKQ